MFPSDDMITLILQLRSENTTQAAIAKRMKINSGYVSRIYSMDDDDLLVDFMLARRKKRALAIIKTADVDDKEYKAERLKILELLTTHHDSAARPSPAPIKKQLRRGPF